MIEKIVIPLVSLAIAAAGAIFGLLGQQQARDAEDRQQRVAGYVNFYVLASNSVSLYGAAEICGIGDGGWFAYDPQSIAATSCPGSAKTKAAITAEIKSYESQREDLRLGLRVAYSKFVAVASPHAQLDGKILIEDIDPEDFGTFDAGNDAKPNRVDLQQLWTDYCSDFTGQCGSQ